MMPCVSSGLSLVVFVRYVSAEIAARGLAKDFCLAPYRYPADSRRLARLIGRRPWEIAQLGAVLTV